MAEYKFINPYNFIPLGEKCVRSHSEEGPLYTGYIRCILTTKTPFIMVDSTSQIEDCHNHKTFTDTFKINGVPSIPASELRGMVRNKFETLTNSCMSNLEKDLPFYGRHKGNMNLPGILDFSTDRPRLYKCKCYLVEGEKNKKKYGKEFNKFSSGECVRFNLKLGKDNKMVFAGFSETGKYEGYIRKGEVCGKNQSFHVFENTGEEVTGCNSDDFKKMFKEIKELYLDNMDHDHIALSKTLMQPVWYEKMGGYVYFSLGQNGQTKNQRRLKDLVNKDFWPCETKENLCEGCRLFGFVNGNESKNGKVRFTDAHMLPASDIYEKEIVLPELASPKYTNALFYMKLLDQDAVVSGESEWNWSADFKSKFNSSKVNTWKIKDGDVMIRGRKEYWHHQPVNVSVEKNKRNISVKPLRKELNYEFKVYFEEISKKELEHLSMSLSLGNNTNFAHKLGLGKPLGYGSVKIQTQEIKVRKVFLENGKVSYVLENFPMKSLSIFRVFNSLNKTQIDAIKHMYDFEFLKDKDVAVDYPRNSEGEDIFRWFKNNKNALPFSDSEYEELIQKGKNNHGNKNARKDENYKSDKKE